MYFFLLFPSPIWKEFDTGNVHKNVLSGSDFHEIRCSELGALFWGAPEFVCVAATFTFE